MFLRSLLIADAKTVGDIFAVHITQCSYVLVQYIRCKYGNI